MLLWLIHDPLNDYAILDYLSRTVLWADVSPLEMLLCCSRLSLAGWICWHIKLEGAFPLRAIWLVNVIRSPAFVGLLDRWVWTSFLPGSDVNRFSYWVARPQSILGKLFQIVYSEQFGQTNETAFIYSVNDDKERQRWSSRWTI